MAEGISSNPNMHYGTYDTGILHPPDVLPKPHIYSDAEGQKMYDEMQHDLYISSKKAKAPERKSPKFFKFLIGFAGIATAGFLVRKPVMKIYTKIMNRIKRN